MAGDYYTLLGVSNDVSAAEIHAAYRRLAKRVHPDVSGDSGLFIRVREARDVLADPVRRARYDASRVTRSARNRPADTSDTSASPGPVQEPDGWVADTWEPWRPDRAAEDRDRRFDTGDRPDRPDRPDPRPRFPADEVVRLARPVGAFLVRCARALPLRSVRGCVGVFLLWLFGPLIIRLVFGSLGHTGAAVGGFLASVLSLTLITLVVVRVAVALRYRWTRGQRVT